MIPFASSPDPVRNTPAAPHLKGVALGLTVSEWVVSLAIASVTGLAAAGALRATSLWAPLGLGFSALAFLHLVLSASRVPAFPEMIVLVAAGSWIVAPLVSYAFPPPYFLFAMATPESDYLAYAVPATMMLAVGMYVLRVPTLDPAWVRAKLTPLEAKERRFLDTMLALGLGISFFGGLLPFATSLAFAYYLLARLALVAAIAWMLTGTNGWKIRVALVFGTLLGQLSAGGVFYEFVLWAVSLVLILAFQRRWRVKLAVGIAVGLALAWALNDVKPAYRLAAGGGQRSVLERLDLLQSMVVQELLRPTPATEGISLVRFNQGWIISRILAHVPLEEPYAEGESILSAVRSSIVPRFLDPDKELASSREAFARFTGLELRSGTSMSLSVPGEFYANFGSLGGMLATLLYGLILGAVYVGLMRLCSRNPLWIAWIPFVTLATLEPNWNVVDILNHTVKAAMVLMALAFLLRKSKVRLFTLDTVAPRVL